MLRTHCLMCAVEEAHCSLPPDCGASFPSMLCPGAQRCTGPVCHAVAVGWMVQRSSNLPPFPRSPGNLLFWIHLRGEVSILEVTVAQEPPFNSAPLGKRVLLSFPFFGDHSLPILTPLLLFSVTCSPPSHMSTHCPVSSISISETSNWQRDTESPESPFSDSLEKPLSISNRPRVPGSSLPCGDRGCTPIHLTDLPWDWLERLTERGIYFRALKQKCTS